MNVRLNSRNQETNLSRLGVLIGAAIFCILALRLPAEEKQEKQILVNPDFTLPKTPSGDPPGWFRAMIPVQTEGFKAGIDKEGETPYIYLEQTGVKINLFNNWAQRIESPPVGASFRLEAEVSLKDVPQGAMVGVFFFGGKDQMLGVAEPKDRTLLVGTKAWTKISVEGKIPAGCKIAIVRLGLNAGGGRIMIKSARMTLLDQPMQSNAPDTKGNPKPDPSSGENWKAGLELLVNGDFEGEAFNETPVSWFRAMMPNLAVGHKAGMEKVDGQGNVVYILQKGTNASLFNNWAQRLEVIPVGARLKLSAQVKTENVPENTGVVMIQCWDTSASEEGKLLSAATSQSSNPIGGTADWKSVEMEITVPEKTNAIIVRCGMMQSGKIWFDNVSLKIISAPPMKKSDAESDRSPRQGFQVSDEAMGQLNQVNDLSTKLLALAREQLGDQVELRKEIYALGDGKFEVVLAFAFH